MKYVTFVEVVPFVLLVLAVIPGGNFQNVSHQTRHFPNEPSLHYYNPSEPDVVAIDQGNGITVDLRDTDIYETGRNDSENDGKFIETSDNAIVFDHVDFVLLRLKHISMQTSSNITEILAVQKEEMEVNSIYKEGWHAAKKLFDDYIKEEIFNNTPDSVIHDVPEEYHISLVAYTLPVMYQEFNADTRDICSGSDIQQYQWKSYFKLLQLAIQTLGTQVKQWRDTRRFLYRGDSRKYDLKEGQILAFQSFISTSAALPVAEGFSSGKSLFQFEGFYNGTAMAIWDHSYFVMEKEVLFSPLQVFRVDSIHEGSHYTRYVLVKHEYDVPNKDIPCDCNSDESGHSSCTLSGSQHLYGQHFIFILAVLMSGGLYALS